MKWEKKMISDLCEIKGGKRLPKNHELIEVETNHPYIRARDIGNGIIDFSKPVFLQESTYNLISRYIVKQDDIVLTIVGANIGDVGLIPKELDGANLTENAVKLTSFNQSCHFKFLLYYFLLPGKKKQLEQVAAGSAQGKLGLYKIKDIEVPIPPVTTQRKIASILSAYDDLIENNLKRIKLLEEKAFSEYRILFSSNKLIEFPIEDVWEIKYGKNLPQTKITETGKYPVYGAAGRIGYFEEFNYESPVALVTSRGNGSGVAHRTNQAAFVTNNSFAFVPKEEFVNVHFHLAEMILRDLELTQLRSGTAQPQLTIAGLIGVKLKLPTSDSLVEFNKICDPVFELIFTLEKQNTKLRESRDILLPRLMSGEIEV